jgi:hypothetical protein
MKQPGVQECRPGCVVLRMSEAGVGGILATVERRAARRAIDAVPVATVPQTIVESFRSPSGWAAIGGRTKRTPKTNDILEHQSNHALRRSHLLSRRLSHCPALKLASTARRQAWGTPPRGNFHERHKRCFPEERLQKR